MYEILIQHTFNHLALLQRPPTLSVRPMALYALSLSLCDRNNSARLRRYYLSLAAVHIAPLLAKTQQCEYPLCSRSSTTPLLTKTRTHTYTFSVNQFNLINFNLELYLVEYIANTHTHTTVFQCIIPITERHTAPFAYYINTQTKTHV